VFSPYLEEMRQAVDARAIQRAAISGVVVPIGDRLNTLLPTAIYISLVSLVGDALDKAIERSSGSPVRKDLCHKIEFLAERNCLADPNMLHEIRARRNDLAHELDCFASWKEVEELFSVLDRELRHLGLR
jgi:hypothetical protein